MACNYDALMYIFTPTLAPWLPNIFLQNWTSPSRSLLFSQTSHVSSRDTHIRSHKAQSHPSRHSVFCSVPCRGKHRVNKDSVVSPMLPHSMSHRTCRVHSTLMSTPTFLTGSRPFTADIRQSSAFLRQFHVLQPFHRLHFLHTFDPDYKTLLRSRTLQKEMALKS